MYYIPAGSFSGNPRGTLEDALDAFCQVGRQPLIALALLGNISSIAFFNFAGISVTKELSATTRMVLDSLRTVVIWALSLALGTCRRLRELRFLGNPLSGRALRRLFAALCELPRLRSVEFPVPRDCYPEGSAYPQDELAMSKFDQQKYDAIAADLRAVLLRAGRDDIQVSTPLFGSFDPDIQETSKQ